MSAALIVTDMLNPYEHEDADALMRSVSASLPALVELIRAAPDEGLLTVYVNDNHGDWSAARAEIVSKALEGTDPGLVRPIAPPPGTPFVVKARHSIFYETQLEYLLRQDGIERLILAGQVTEQCILYSALDGYVRHFDITIASDAVAPIHEHLAAAALEMMHVNMRAQVLPGPQALDAAIDA
jgi:nicotinamidase-related amidase